MSVRAMWKGTLHVHDEAVPVKLYAAITSRKTSFRLLDPDDASPVKQQLYDPESGDEVDRDDVQKAYEVEPGVFAVLSEEDLAALEPEASRDLTVSRMVPADAIDDRWYDRAYWLGPDGSEEDYDALSEALEASGRIGVTHWVMRKKRYQGALRVREGRLVLVTLRHPEEVVPLDAVAAPEGRAPDDKESKLARQLIEALDGDFDPSDFPETYADRVNELVAAKAKGEEPTMPEPSEKQASDDEGLSGALEQSLKELGHG